MTRAISGLALAGGLVYAWGRWEARSIQVTRHRHALAGWNPGPNPLRIAHLSDLHRGLLVPEERIARAATMAMAERPDLIVLTGDFISYDPHYIDSCVRALSCLSAPLGIWAVPGNHDYIAGDLKRLTAGLAVIGVRFLINDNHRLESGLRLVGFDDRTMGEPDYALAWSGLPESDPAIVLAHNPRQFNKIDRANCLMLSGHTHGGQVNLPYRGWLVRHHRDMLSGWYHREGSSLFVNRGIGVTKTRIRLLARPEVAIIELANCEPVIE